MCVRMYACMMHVLRSMMCCDVRGAEWPCGVVVRCSGCGAVVWCSGAVVRCSGVVVRLCGCAVVRCGVVWCGGAVVRCITLSCPIRLISRAHVGKGRG